MQYLDILQLHGGGWDMDKLWHSTYTSSSAKYWLPRGILRPTVVSSKLTPCKCLVMVAFCPSKRFSVKALPCGVRVDGDVYRDFVQDTGHKWQCLRTNPVNLSNLVWQHDNTQERMWLLFFSGEKLPFSSRHLIPRIWICVIVGSLHMWKKLFVYSSSTPIYRGGRCIFLRAAFNYCGRVSETSGSSDFTLPEGDCRSRGDYVVPTS
jgi:hypothetical protein